MSDEIAKVLALLAERFGTTIDHLWEVMVIQAYVQSLSTFIIVLLIIILLVIDLKKWPKWWNDADNDNETAMIKIVITGAFTVAGIFIIIDGYQSMITGLFNPEYWALQRILELLQ